MLITACLLHDIAREEQFENPHLDHASLGAEKARRFLLEYGFDTNFADKVAGCVSKHRFRSDNQPNSIEEKILFDSDKIDATGTIEIARTLLYKGNVGEPLYSVNFDGLVSDGSKDKQPSFFQEYKFKLEKIYSQFYTARGKEIALQGQQSAVDFYEKMYHDEQESYMAGKTVISKHIT